MITPLSAEEVSFLARHGYSAEDIYDGRYQSKETCAAAAKDAGKHLVLAGVIRRGSA